MLVGMNVDFGPGNIALDWDSATPKEHSPNFRPKPVVDWMNQNATL